MEENKTVKVKAKMVASFPRGQWEDEVKFDCELTVNCKDGDRSKIDSGAILSSFLERLQLISAFKKTAFLFTLVDHEESGAHAINIQQVNYFYVDDWMFIDDEEEK